MKQLKWFWNNLEEVVGAFLLLFIAILAFANVITRYFLKYSFAFSEELEVAAMVFLTMFGASSAFKHNLHLRLIFFESKISKKFSKALHIFSNLMSLLLFLAIGFLSYFHIRDAIELEMTTEALNIPEWIYISAIPIGSILIIIRTTQNIIKILKDNK